MGRINIHSLHNSWSSGGRKQRSFLLMFSQFRHVVEGLAQPRPPQASFEHGQPPSSPKPLAERPLKAKLEDRLRASFTIGEASSPSTPSASSRVSPAPQFINEHPLSLSIDHPLSPAAIPLPSSPPPTDHDHGHVPLAASLTLPDPLSDVLDKLVPTDPGSNIVVEPEPASQYSPPKSPSVVCSEISQVTEQKPAASEEGTDKYDAALSVTPDISCDQANSVSNMSAGEIAPADQHESSEVPIPTETSQSGHSVSADVEALQQRLKWMEQQFTGRS